MPYPGYMLPGGGKVQEVLAPPEEIHSPWEAEHMDERELQRYYQRHEVPPVCWHHRVWGY